MGDKVIKRKEYDKPRVLVYAIEFSFAIFGIVFLVLSLTGNSFEMVPKGSQLTSSITAILMAFAMFAVEKIFRFHFPIMLHIIYIVYAFTANIIGANFGVFHYGINIMGENLGWYDKVMHAVLGYVLCVVAIYLSQKVKLWGKTKSGDVLLILAISMAFASLWEIYEFAVDHIIPGQSMQRNSLLDTMLDMIAHFVTTLLFVAQYLIEKLAKVNLGIAFIENNLQKGGRVPKKIDLTENAKDLNNVGNTDNANLSVKEDTDKE